MLRRAESEAGVADADRIVDDLYQQCFRMPQAQSLVGRRTTINNAFANAILPKIRPSIAEIREALAILGMTPHSIRCAYCSGRYTEWDHLRPIVQGAKPTGFLSEIGNLVPCCGKCNQSKGNQDWDVWIVSNAPLSPKALGAPHLDENIARLKAFAAWRPAPPLNLEGIVGTDSWAAYWQKWAVMMDALNDAQQLADELRARVEAHRRK